MKQFLFTLAAVTMSSSACFAQALLSPVQKKASFTTTSLATKVSAKEADASAFRSFADSRQKTVASGVWYHRPEGSLFVGLQQGSAHVIPCLQEAKFINMCTDKAASSWTMNGRPVEGADADNNMPVIWGVNASGSIYYPYVINAGGESWSDVDGLYPQHDIFSGLEFFNSSKCGAYTGYSGGEYCFGTVRDRVYTDRNGTPDDESDDVVYPYTGKITQFLEKPTSPMYVESILMPAVSSGVAIAPGKKITMKIYDAYTDEDGKKVLGQIELASLEATAETTEELGSTAETTFYMLNFYQNGEDDFGNPIPVPFTISDEYAVVISGLLDDGIDVGFRMGDVAETEEDYGRICATLETYADDEGNERQVWSYGEFPLESGQTVKVSYTMMMLFNSFFDGINVYNDDRAAVPYTFVRVSDDGKTCSLEADKTIGGALVETAAPWINEQTGLENYTVEFTGDADWVMGVSADEEARQAQGPDDNDLWPFSILKFTAMPIQEGGRYAVANVIGRGVTGNAPIVLLQGDITADEVIAAGIDNVVTDKQAAASKNVYNLNGQRVSENAKGVVIKNGVKVVNK